MQLLINGQPRDVPEGLTVTGLLELLAVKAPRVAVEVNQSVVKRADHPTTPLKPGDAVEIVTFVGGG